MVAEKLPEVNVHFVLLNARYLQRRLQARDRRHLETAEDLLQPTEVVHLTEALGDVEDAQNHGHALLQIQRVHYPLGVPVGHPVGQLEVPDRDT